MRSRTLTLLNVALATVFFTISVKAESYIPQPVNLFAGMHHIEAEVAATLDNRASGLMYRRSMPAQHGMLFVFPVVAKHCMWMRNTYLPLSVAFLDEQGTIINIEEMEPQTENNHCALKPVRYALEMNAGWFKSRGLDAGFKIVGVSKLTSSH
ncbi:hypothetical protein PG1C_08485 [Rugosibacter aromaticivorans]|uniref:Uncharacterized protein n=1 Tax=Rugosibacter aromaticivorans TaxID=1565605 RepID=A0A0C5J0A4_9PROT|nr:DUF192 domain-containing protein [Rugosibacter aromaticivorans]AJP48482.1 hypothetical protein PG1C_08485 [Rugosibacter aromaticivorans]TBR15356.1 MAG: DUF192 domain-containing protein [Rugosibacter sp.]